MVQLDTDNASSSVEYSYDADKDEYTIDNEVYKYKMHEFFDEDSAESCNILCNDLHIALKMYKVMRVQKTTERFKCAY